MTTLVYGTAGHLAAFREKDDVEILMVSLIPEGVKAKLHFKSASSFKLPRALQRDRAEAIHP